MFMLASYTKMNPLHNPFPKSNSQSVSYCESAEDSLASINQKPPISVVKVVEKLHFLVGLGSFHDGFFLMLATWCTNMKTASLTKKVLRTLC